MSDEKTTRIYGPDGGTYTEGDCELFGRPDDECLHHTDKNEAIEEILDGWHPAPLEGTLEIAGFIHEEISIGHHADSALENLLEWLDEEYGNPDDYTRPSEKMKAAAQTFVKAVAEDYHVWACREVWSETIDVRAWVAKHRPDWLEQEKEHAGKDAGDL